MDPITLSTSFATIVSLIGTYASEARADKSKNLESFLAWLQENRHEEIYQLIKENSQISNSIKQLLQEGQSVIMEKLSELDKMMALIASRLDYFGEIAVALKPNMILSSQAISLLQQFNSSGGSVMLENEPISSKNLEYEILDGNDAAISIEEPRFIEDDLMTLCELGLLRLEYLGQARTFRFTRQAAAFVAALPKT